MRHTRSVCEDNKKLEIFHLTLSNSTIILKNCQILVNRLNMEYDKEILFLKEQNVTNGNEYKEINIFTVVIVCKLPRLSINILMK